MVASTSSADSPADDISLPADHGYLLIRVTNKDGINIFRRDRIVFNNYDTDESFRVSPKTSYTAGANAWLSLISATKGHYYFSRYESWGSSVQGYTGDYQRQATKTTISDDDIFEVKSGVINYAGDWDLTPLLRQRLDSLDVKYDMTTVAKSMAHFPKHLGKYEVFISIKGKKTISLNDFVDIWKKNSGSDDE